MTGIKSGGPKPPQSPRSEGKHSPRKSTDSADSSSTSALTIVGKPATLFPRPTSAKNRGGDNSPRGSQKLPSIGSFGDKFTQSTTSNPLIEEKGRLLSGTGNAPRKPSTFWGVQRTHSIGGGDPLEKSQAAQNGNEKKPHDPFTPNRGGGLGKPPTLQGVDFQRVLDKRSATQAERAEQTHIEGATTLEGSDGSSSSSDGENNLRSRPSSARSATARLELLREWALKSDNNED